MLDPNFYYGMALLVVLAGAVAATRKRKSIGCIRCNRCQHQGEAKVVFILFRGHRALCERCDGEFWEQLPGDPTVSMTPPRQEGPAWIIVPFIILLGGAFLLLWFAIMGPPGR